MTDKDASQNPTLRPRRERWKQVMLTDRALVKLTQTSESVKGNCG